MDPIIRAMPVGDAPRALLRPRSTPAPVPPTAPVSAPPPAASALPQAAPAPQLPSLAEQLERQVALARAGLQREMAAELERERERLRAEAKQAREREREEARREGFAVGQEQAAAQARAALQQESARLQAAVASLGQGRADLLEQVEDEAVEIVFCALTRLLGAALVGREQVAAQLKHLLAQARGNTGLTVRLHPDDAALLESGVDGRTGLGPDVAVRADREVVLGGCLIDGPQGRLDLRLETQLDQLRETLLAVRAARRAGARP